MIVVITLIVEIIRTHYETPTSNNNDCTPCVSHNSNNSSQTMNAVCFNLPGEDFVEPVT